MQMFICYSSSDLVVKSEVLAPASLYDSDS